LARIYFRIDPTQVNHARYEYDFATFLGDIGGIYELLFFLVFLLLGSFLSFNASFEIMKDLSSYVYCHEAPPPSVVKDVKRPLPPLKN